MPERALFWRRGKEWAVRRGPWKLVGNAKSEMILFNLDDDIEEQKDLAKESPNIVEELLVLYREWEKDVAGKK